MVSPEGESLKLIEPIDPKGQNVEAWMLELEGNMRLTVRWKQLSHITTNLDRIRMHTLAAHVVRNKEGASLAAPILPC